MKGLETILEQSKQDRLKEYLKNLNMSEKTQEVIDNGNLLADEVAMCKVCGNISDDEYYTLTDEDGVEDLTISFEELYFDDLKKFQPYLDNIVTDARKEIDNVRVGIVFEIDTSVDPYDKLDDAEKDKFLELTSVEEDLLTEICYILETLLVYSVDSKASEPTKALTYYKEICKLFKPKKAAEEEVVNPVDDEDEAKGKMGCMKEGASNYNSIYKRACDGCCTYKVPLAPITSYDISFYASGQFQTKNKETMVHGREYEMCVLEYEYDNNMVEVNGKEMFDGYQDDNVPSLKIIEKDTLEFKDDAGFYSNNLGADERFKLVSDVNRAMTWYMARVAGSTDTIWDNCTPLPLSMNDVIVEIKDLKGVNHGVIRFDNGKPTLRVYNELGYTNWLNYRASNTPSSALKFVNTTDEGGYRRLNCEKWKSKSNYTSKSDFDCVKYDKENGWITISKTVKAESKIGLGNLLGRKEKTITGLGSLLED